MTPDEFDRFIAENKAHAYVADRILGKVNKALREAGNPIVAVYDGDEETDLGTPGKRRDLDRLVYNLDDAWLITKDGGWVRFIAENEWDCLADYSLGLEDALKPVNEWVDRRSR